MYVCMYVCICNVDGCNYLRPSVFLFVCIHYVNLEHVCMHIYCMFVCMYVCMYVCTNLVSGCLAFIMVVVYNIAHFSATAIH